MKKYYLLLFIFLPILAFAKSYYYPQIKTDIYFSEDGSAQVLQQRTYAFDGSFSWAFVDLKKKGAQDIIINQVAEKINDLWQPLTAEIQNNENSVYVRWNYSAENESKIFLLDYTIIGAVKRFEDVSEFYWKFIEDTHENIDEIILELNLPQNSPDLFKVYIHSQSKPGMLQFNNAFDKAYVRQTNITKDAFVEVHMLASPSIFPEIPMQPQKRYQDILSTEKRNFLLSSIRKFVLFPIGLLLMIVLPVILLLTFYYRYGREPKLPYIGIYEHEPPRKISPVLIPAILFQKPDRTTIFQNVFRSMFATLLNLTTKGLISIQELKVSGKTNYQFNLEKTDRLNELDPIDRNVISFFFNQRNSVTDTQNGFDLIKSISDKELKKYAENHRLEFQRLLSETYNNTVEWWKKTLGGGLLDSKSNRFYNIFIICIIPSILLGTLLAGSGLSALIGGPNPSFFAIPFALGMILFVIHIFTGRAILRWSPEAYLEQRRWRNFKKFLTDFSAIEQAPITLLPIWESYFVYAVALGVAQKFLKNISSLALKQNQPLVLPVWYIAASQPGSANVASFAESMSNFEAFTSNFTSMMNSFSTSASTGGGFSGGGGGGGGGGSSGAG